MIIDTSALIATLHKEEGHEALKAAIYDAPLLILPAPTRLEFLTVARGARFDLSAEAEVFLDDLAKLGMTTHAWEERHAIIAAEAQRRYGKGNGRGGTLNLLDLMVYAVAKERGEPLLFTGRDFSTTDVLIHPASRLQ